MTTKKDLLAEIERLKAIILELNLRIGKYTYPGAVDVNQNYRKEFLK